MLQDQVIGILDWELSTLGNQMSDVAYSCVVLAKFQISVFWAEGIFFCIFYSTLCCRCSSLSAYALAFFNLHG